MGFATALIAGKGPGLSSSALFHSSCSETQLKAAHHALRPKITLHVSHPESNADSSSPQTFSYFWCNGKIFHSAKRRELTSLKKLFFSPPFRILWSWQNPQCGFDGNQAGHLSKHRSFIYSASWSVQDDKKSVSFVCCGHILPYMMSGFYHTKSLFSPRNVLLINVKQCDSSLVLSQPAQASGSCSFKR